MDGTRLDTLPVHPHADVDVAGHRLRIDGLARHPLELSLADLLALPQRAVDDSFTCLEGWSVERLRWGGVALETVLTMAGALPEARWVQASSGDFSLPLPMTTARTALLALTLDGAPLPIEHGAPVRLLLPGGECFTSVKWLDHIELRETPAENTAGRIARARIGIDG